MTGGIQGARTWARAELRRRWLALVMLGALAGVTAGLAVAATAGARRTETAWDSLRDATTASDAIVFTSQAGIYTEPELGYEQFTDVPYIEQIGAFGLAYGITGDGEFGAAFVNTFGDWLVGVDTPRIIEGRAPDPDAPHEVVISKPDADGPLAGMDVGDQIDVSFLTLEQQVVGRFDAPEGPSVTLEVVGVGDSPFDIAAIPSNGDIYLGPAFRERYGPDLAVFSNLVVRLEDPERDVPRLEAEVARLYPGRGVPVYDLFAASKRVTNGTGVERSGLLLFAAAVSVAGIVIIGQALTRSVRAAAGDVPTLVSLGFSRSDATLALSLPHVASALVAAVVTVVVALALSPRFPIGLGRRVDPDVGFHVDAPVVLGGATLVGGVLALAVVATAWRAATLRAERRPTSPSAIAAACARLGAPVTVSTGARLALEPGRGQRALPTRPALLGAVAGVLGVIGALTLAAGIGDATSHPERFGAVWDFELYAEATPPPEKFVTAAEQLADDPEVSDVARIARLTLPVGDVVLPFYAVDDVDGSIEFVLLEGRAPARPGEVVLGPDSADLFRVGVGDEVRIGEGGRFDVVGLGLLPTTAHSSFDQGGWLLPDDLARSVPETQRSALALQASGSERALTDAETRDVMFEVGLVMARLGDGVDTDAALARIRDQLGDEVAVERASEPADQQNLRNIRPLPILFAVFALALALGGLAHVSVSVLRRRRGELAVLRSLGLTPRQARACLSWQAMTLTVIGLVIGLPLGVALGRVVWRVVAEATPMVHVAPLAVFALLLAAPAALVLANALAAVPGRRAARLRPAEVLRTE